MIDFNLRYWTNDWLTMPLSISPSIFFKKKHKIPSGIISSIKHFLRGFKVDTSGLLYLIHCLNILPRYECLDFFFFFLPCPTLFSPLQSGERLFWVTFYFLLLLKNEGIWSWFSREGETAESISTQSNVFPPHQFSLHFMFF